MDSTTLNSPGAARRRFGTLAMLLPLVGAGLVAPAWVLGQGAAPASGGLPRSDRPNERVVISLPNGTRIERNVSAAEVSKLGVKARTPAGAPAASVGNGDLAQVPGPRGMDAGGSSMKSGRTSGGRAADGRTVVDRVSRPVQPGSAAAETGAAAVRVEGTGADQSLVLGWVPDRLGGGRYAEVQPARIPERPTHVRVVDSGGGRAELSWVIASSNQAAFVIERTPAFANGQPRLAGPGQTMWVDECGPGVYSYTIRAVNEDARSAPTDPVEVTMGSNEVSLPPLLIPGSGWAGPTGQPSAVGSPSDRGYDAKVIARFDAVPHMSVDGHVDVGVVAFHMNGVQRVDFAAEGGPWVSATEMTLNAQTGVWEYVVRVQASDYPGGPVEVRAIAYPVTGIPRVLPPLMLNVPSSADGPTINMFVSPIGSDATGNGTRENPYRSINKAAKEIEIRQNGIADGGVINLLQGDYSWGPAGRDADDRWISYPATDQRYLTIQPAPGLGKRDVRIVDAPGGGLRTKLIHLRNLTVVACQIDNAQPTNSDAATIWIHGCTFLGPSIIQAVRWVPADAYLGGVYITNTVVRDSAEGWSGVTMLRGCTIDAIGDDAFVNCQMVVNCEVRNIINPDGTGFHSDVLQYHAIDPGFDNIIVYNLRAVNNTSQAWNVGYTRRGTGPEWSNIAFVNVVCDQSPDGYSASWAADANHVLWWNLTIPIGPLFLIDHPDVQDGVYFPSRIRNFSMRGCVLQKFNLGMTSGEPAISDPTWADNNHFIDTTSHGAMTAGTRFTTGGSMTDLFASPGIGDFSAKMGSVLCDREGPPLLPNDSMGRRTGAYRAIGAMQPLQP